MTTDWHKSYSYLNAELSSLVETPYLDLWQSLTLKNFLADFVPNETQVPMFNCLIKKIRILKVKLTYMTLWTSGCKKKKWSKNMRMSSSGEVSYIIWEWFQSIGWRTVCQEPTKKKGELFWKLCKWLAV